MKQVSRWTAPIPHRGRGGAAGRANSKKDPVTGPIRGFCALHATLTARGEGGRALGEPADLDQILDNLIDNAVAYAPGPVVIETGRADGRAFLAVEDVGPGIAADERHRVTDRFFRGRTAPKGGTGLGLAIVRELAEKWGGTVLVEPADGGGTRIVVRLKAAT